MGNLASTVQAATAHPPMVGEPPPECPMHQKKPPPAPSASECPINAGGEAINPLNMVCGSSVFLLNNLSLLDF